MKPISIRFKCFGPYIKEQLVDFEELEKNGLFLICGETGAGKTTILDAICYALYGKSSGGLRGDFTVMRCKLAPKEEETLVEFIFDANGKLYKFVRSLRCRRKNIHDYHNCMILEGGEYVPLFENPKKTIVNKKAEELIGLTYEQFRQVIILPQGQFEKLLVSNSEDKETILVSLFKADKWHKIAEELYKRVSRRDDELKQELADIKSRLADYHCSSIEELGKLLTYKQEKLTESCLELAAAEKTEARERAFYDMAVTVNAGFTELEMRRKKAAELSGRIEAIQQETRQLERADRAELLKPEFDAYCAGKKAKEKAVRQQLAAKAALAEIMASLAAANQAQAAHKAGAAGYEENRRHLALLENMQGVYASLTEKKQAVAAAEKEEARQQADFGRADRMFTESNQAWLQAMARQQEKMAAYTEAQNLYLSGISGTLAAKLRSGCPCPVCGSTTHPNPATVGGTKITEEELNTRSKAMTQVNAEVQEEADLRRNAEQQREQALQASSQAARTAAAVQAEYKTILQHKVEGIDTTAQLTKALTQLNAALRQYEAEGTAIQQTLTEASGNHKVAEAALEQAQQTVREADNSFRDMETRWMKQLADSEFESEADYQASMISGTEKAKRREAVIRFHADLDHAGREVREQEQKLEGKVPPDMTALEELLNRAVEIQKEKSRVKILAQQAADKLSGDLEALSKRKAAYDPRRVAADADLEFANRLRGRSGLSLQRYVLGVMLSSITAEANRLLQSVHGGRYRLYRTNEIAGSGHKGGLELEVLDSQSNECRSVTTLSGGEKFLVALSLAIGLSAVVQAQGSGLKLGAMFIDEGFGTLDQNCIADALEILQGIQRANGLVGIISHVGLLRSEIPSKIEIVKGKDGSYIGGGM